MLKRIINNISKKTLGVSVNDVQNIVSTINAINDFTDEIVEQKSVSGATDVYLKQIERDFPDFHKNDADVALKSFIDEYLKIKYEGQKDFVVSNVDKNIIGMIENHKLNVDVKNVIINKISISGYRKSDEYATIDYNASVGYDISGKRIETRYKVKYTLRLNQDNVASVAMICPNCGATIESTSLTKCEYCDSKIIRDTILSWIFTNIEEYYHRKTYYS